MLILLIIFVNCIFVNYRLTNLHTVFQKKTFRNTLGPDSCRCYCTYSKNGQTWLCPTFEHRASKSILFTPTMDLVTFLKGLLFDEDHEKVLVLEIVFESKLVGLEQRLDLVFGEFDVRRPKHIFLLKKYFDLVFGDDSTWMVVQFF